MPQAIAAIPALLGTYAAAYGASYALVTGLATVALGLLKTAALTFLQKTLAKRSGRGAPPINITIRSTIAERRILFGTVRAGGAFLFVRTSGDNNKYLWYVIAYAGHQCEDVRDLYLDKFMIADADINSGTGAVSTTALDGKLKCWTHLGTQAQTVDTNLDSEFTEWTSTHRLRGICYRVLRLERSDKAWPTGAPQSCSSIVDGLKLYDPRQDSTNGGTGSHRRDDPSTWGFSHNAALALRWFLSGGSVINDDTTRLVKYGLREDDSRIDDAYIITAANICDESLSGANAPPSGAQVRYTCDLEASCGQTRREIIEEILECLGPGQMVWVHGKWRVYAGAYDAPTHSFTELDLHGELEVEDTDGEEDRFNQICGVFIDASKDYTEQTTTIRSNAAYVTQDAGKKILKTVSLRGVTNEYRAQRIIERMLRSARQMRTVKTMLGRQGMAVAPWETGEITHTRYGWDARVFRCVERQMVWNQDNGLNTQLTWQATDESVDVDLETADYTTGTAVVNSIQSETPDAPTSLVAISLARAIEFNWVLGDFWERNGSVEIWEHTSSTPFASATRIWVGRGTRAVIQKTDTTIRYYWARVVTIADEASDTEPASTGLAAAALRDPELISDGGFELATDNTYWQAYSSYSGTGAATGVAIATSGGVNGGRLALTGDSTEKWVWNKRASPYAIITGQDVRVRWRWRRTGSITSASGSDVIVQLAVSTTFGDIPPTGSTGATQVGTYNLTQTVINAVNVNEWQEAEFMATALNVPKNTTQLPFFELTIVMFAACTGGTLHIDQVQAHLD